jgi:hypothetical protein
MSSFEAGISGVSYVLLQRKRLKYWFI